MAKKQYVVVQDFLQGGVKLQSKGKVFVEGDFDEQTLKHYLNLGLLCAKTAKTPTKKTAKKVVKKPAGNKPVKPANTKPAKPSNNK